MKVISHSKALHMVERRQATLAAMERVEKDEAFMAFLAEQAEKYPHGCMFPPAK